MDEYDNGRLYVRIDEEDNGRLHVIDEEDNPRPRLNNDDRKVTAMRI
jgi:hypothetical protein